MTEFLNIVNEYAQLINFVLFVAIIGWLLKISLISRTALKDKHDAVIASKDSRISELETSSGIMKSQMELIEKDRDILRSEINDGNVNANEILASLEILKRKADAEVEEAQDELNRVMSRLQLKEKEIEKLQTANSKFFADISGRQDLQLSMISSVAHETRAITSSIMHRVHYILSATKKDEQIDKKTNLYLNDIITELEMLTQMYNVFLHRDRIIEPQITIFALQNIIDDVLNIFKNQILRKNLKVKLMGLEKLPKVQLDASTFTQAIVNIINNSISYSEKGGKIIVIGEKKPDGIQLRFQDFGIGIAQKDKDKIFEAFYVAIESRKVKVSGTGLGLYVTKKIIESYGGQITVSNSRMPTEFKIILPTRVEIKR